MSVSSQSQFMKECKITPNEYEILVGILMAQDEEDYSESMKYETESEHPSHVADTSYLLVLQDVIGRDDLRVCLKSLQEKGIILKTCKIPEPGSPEGLRVNDVKFNKNIIKKYLRHSGEMFWELWHAYPKDCVINGKIVPLRNTFGQGGWSNVDEAASFYGNKIKYDAALHREILNCVEKAAEMDIINMGIIKFLRGEEWRNLETQLENNIDNEYL